MRVLNKKYWPYRLENVPSLYRPGNRLTNGEFIKQEAERSAWCDEHCKNRWTWVPVQGAYFDNFYFVDEQDMTLFALKWL
jgi:hypothetical protein